MHHSPPTTDAPTIEAAVAHLADLRPAYAAILTFYGAVFTAQAQAEAATSPAAIDVDETLLAMKSKEGFALIEPAAFTIDLPAAETLLATICRIAASSGEKLGGAGQALLDAMADGLAVTDLFYDVLCDSGQIQALADRLNVSADMVSLLVYLAVKPSVAKGARQLADQVTAQSEMRGNCPVCGSAPIIGELDLDGQQWLHCGFCWQRWPVGRLACPFCSNRDSGSLEYVYSDDEPEYRVNLCGHCRRYLKVADRRKMSRIFYAPLEQVASLHLDMLMADKGYRHAVASGNGSPGRPSNP